MFQSANDYKVGYGKPPTASQFRKGVRPPRKAQPAIMSYLRQLLIKELKHSTEVVIEGRRIKMTKAAILVKRLVDQGINKPSPQLLQILMQTLSPVEPSDPPLAQHERAEIESVEAEA